MNKKENYLEAQAQKLDEEELTRSNLQQQIQQQQQLQQKSKPKHSKQYYKLFHTLTTLQTLQQPISIHQCMTPMIAQRIFKCKLNQKLQINDKVLNYINKKKQKKQNSKENIKNKLLEENQVRNRKGSNGNIVVKEKNSSYVQQKIEQDDDDGFNIGEKDDVEDVVQIGMKYMGNLMKGFNTAMSYAKNTRK